MLLLVWSQCTAQVGRQITTAAPGSHAIAEHLPAYLQHPMSEIVRAAGLYLTKSLEQFGRLNVGDRAFTKRRENIDFQVPINSNAMTRRPGVQLLSNAIPVQRPQMSFQPRASFSGLLPCARRKGQGLFVAAGVDHRAAGSVFALCGR